MRAKKWKKNLFKIPGFKYFDLGVWKKQKQKRRQEENNIQQMFKRQGRKEALIRRSYGKKNAMCKPFVLFFLWSYTSSFSVKSCAFSENKMLWIHLGPEQLRIQTEVLGYSSIRSLVCSHRSLMGQWMMAIFSVFFSILDHIGIVDAYAATFHECS